MLSHKEQIGRLDRRITFQKKVVGTNESNEDEETGWQDIATNPTVWASKEERTGNESYAADKLTGFQGVTFTCRFRTDVDITMRLLCGGLAYNIHSLVEVGRKRYLQVFVESGYQYVESASVQGGFDYALDIEFQ